MFSVWSWKGRSEEQGKIGKVDMKGFSIEAGRSGVAKEFSEVGNA